MGFGDPKIDITPGAQDKRKVSLDRFLQIKQLAALREEERNAEEGSPEQLEIGKRVTKFELQLGDFNEYESDLDALLEGRLETDVEDIQRRLEEEKTAPQKRGPKSREDLEGQVRGVSYMLSEELLRATNDKNIFDLPASEIKERFPRRYEIYLRGLRLIKNSKEIDKSEALKMAKWLRLLNNLDRYIAAYEVEGDKSGFKFREGQFSIFTDLRDAIEEGCSTGYIKLPTGVGKTVLFTKFIEATGLSALIVVPSKDLIRQTEEKLREFVPGRKVGAFYSDRKKLSGDIDVTTYSSLLNAEEGYELQPEKYDMLILDEAHKMLGPETYKKVQGLSNELKLGFTATPTYSAEKNLRKNFGREIASLTIPEAISMGLILMPTVMIKETQVDISSVPIVGGDYDEKELAKNINEIGRNKKAVDMYKENFNGKLAIAFCAGVQHAKDVAKLFNETIKNPVEGGVAAAVITGEESEDERKKLIADYHEGKILVLCNAKVLLEGFDEPRASVILNLAPTTSVVRAIQRLGRGLRVDEENPDKAAVVVDFLDKVRHGQEPVLAAEAMAEGDPNQINEIIKILEDGERDQGPRRPAAESRQLLSLTKDELEKLRLIVDETIIVDVKKIIDKARDIIEGRILEAPSSWKTMSDWAKDLGLSERKVKLSFESLKDNFPDQFGNRKSRGKKKEIFEFFDPVFASATRAAERADYRTLSDIAQELKQNKTILKFIIEKEFDAVDNYVPYSEDKGDMLISPECIAKIKTLIDEWKPLPQGAKLARNFLLELKPTKEEIMAPALINDLKKPYKDETGLIDYYVTQEDQYDILRKLKRTAKTTAEIAPEGSIEKSAAYSKYGEKYVSYWQGQALLPATKFEGKTAVKIGESIYFTKNFVDLLDKHLVEGNDISNLKISIDESLSIKKIDEIYKSLPDNLRKKKQKSINKTGIVYFSPEVAQAIKAEIVKRRNSAVDLADLKKDGYLTEGELFGAVKIQLEKEGIQTTDDILSERLGKMADFDQKTVTDKSSFEQVKVMNNELVNRLYITFFEEPPVNAENQLSPDSRFFQTKIAPLGLSPKQAIEILKPHQERLRTLVKKYKSLDSNGNVQEFWSLNEEGEEFVQILMYAHKGEVPPGFHTKEKMKEMFEEEKQKNAYFDQTASFEKKFEAFIKTPLGKELYNKESRIDMREGKTKDLIFTDKFVSNFTSFIKRQ